MNDEMNDLDYYHHMRTALSLAHRTLGCTWPNPAVGCVIVKNDMIISRGWTSYQGRPHAEQMALEKAKNNAKGSTVFVTFEPCSHHGQTPPCSQSLIDAQVKHVVMATLDPDTRVCGKGYHHLKKAGIKVTKGILEQEALDLNQGFISKICHHQPIFTLKIASTLDGKSALSNGQSQWITGNIARKAGHFLRANHDAILVGRGTAQFDDPTLTCRIEGLEHRSPVRIVVDGHGKLDPNLKVFQDKKAPTWVMCFDPQKARSHFPQHVKTLQVNSDEHGKADLLHLANVLAQEGLTRVLIESGGLLASAFLKYELISHIEWFRSSSLIGAQGRNCIGNLNMTELENLPSFDVYDSLNLGNDQYIRLKKRG